MTIRYRITYSKTAALRYTGTLDMQRSWERTIRRAGLPIAYSQGFHPQPRLQQASALPLGFTSRYEMMDIWLENEVSPEALTDALQSAAPPGVESIRVSLVDPKSPPLQTQVTSAVYEVTLLESTPVSQLAGKINEILSTPTLERRWKDKSYDLRPLIESISWTEPASGEPIRLTMQLSAREAATGRPEEVLSALGLDPLATRIERIHLIFKENML